MLHGIRTALESYKPTDLPRRANSAVLIPLLEREGDVEVVLIQRSEEIGHHRGQMGFPGGMVEARDNGDLLSTALRESQEEIRILREDVEVIGELSQRRTITSELTVKPFVGIIPAPYIFTPDPREVQAVHTASLGTMAREVMRGWNPFHLPPPVYPVNGRAVWGLTARIITELLEVTGIQDLGSKI